MQARWTIKHTWDGCPLETSAHVRLQLEQEQEGGLIVSVDAPFHDDPAPTSSVGSTWELWNHEVVELFLVRQDGSYLEIEIGPHGHFLVLDLSAPRVIRTRHLPATLTVTRTESRWSGRIEVQVECPLASIVRANAFAIHGTGDTRQFLAASPLPGIAPDFHQPERFPLFACHTADK